MSYPRNRQPGLRSMGLVGSGEGPTLLATEPSLECQVTAMRWYGPRTAGPRAVSCDCIRARSSHKDWLAPRQLGGGKPSGSSLVRSLGGRPSPNTDGQTNTSV